MQYVWQHRLWPPRHLRTVDGASVQVLDPGRLNTHAGPDFFNAKVKIDGHLWAGDVEIHVKASDWHRHHHDGDPAYDSVILHVVDRDDTMIRRPNGEVIPQMLMPCSPTLNEDYRSLVEHSVRDLPCATFIPSVHPLHITDWMSSLTIERLYTRSEHIGHILSIKEHSREEAAYVLLARALGFGTNAEPFERLARSLPLRIIGKHADSLLSIEALLLGQSGLLNPYLSNPIPSADPYVQALAREYRFLSTKFGLQPLEAPAWKMARMRPANFPHRRIAILARMLLGGFKFHSQALEVGDAEEAARLFDIELTGFWAQHYHLEGPAAEGVPRKLSRASVNLLIINVIVPLLFNYAQSTGRDRYVTLATDLLESLPPERNTIVDLFVRAGLNVRSAAVSQALIHLRRNYCEQRKCLYCRLGHRMLAEKARRDTTNSPQ